MCVIRVFSGASVSPRSVRNPSTSGFTSWVKTSGVRPVMMKSSAHLTRLIDPAWRCLVVRCSRPRTFSNPLSVRLHSTGEATPLTQRKHLFDGKDMADGNFFCNRIHHDFFDQKPN